MRQAFLAWTGAVLAMVAPAGAATISIMPLGDSITAGTVNGGYRLPMLNKLTNTYKVSVSTIGTQTDTSISNPAWQAHEGHGGWRIDGLQANLLGYQKIDTIGDSAHGGHWLDGGNGTGRGPISPTVVTVMAGINDINSYIGSYPSPNPSMADRSDEIMNTIEGRMTSLVSTLTSTLPNTKVLLGGCIPFANGLFDDRLTGANATNRQLWMKSDGVTNENQELGVNHWVLMFNKWIRDTYVPQLRAAGKKVYYVDQYKNFILADGSVRGWNNQEPYNTNGPDGYGDYGLHPNQFGYNLMGATWADAIKAYVVPEPASLGTVGVVGVILGRRRRRAS